MATIALYQGKINNMPGLIKDVKSSVTDFKSELFTIKNKSLQVNQGVCNLNDIISLLSTSTQTQEQKVDSLEAFQKDCEQFIDDTASVDSNVAGVINKNKSDFYSQYSYLKPDSERNLLENLWNGFKSGLESTAQWCKEHWKEILATAGIIIGAALAILAVVCTGGMALAPLLASLLTALGMASGTALTVATVTSVVIAGIAVTSTLVSSTLNLVDTWGDMSGNSTFQSWKTAMNWISMISNGFYSVGAIYNAFHGISHTALREYGKQYLTNPNFRSNILNSNTFNFSLKPNSSVFWTGMRENSGEHVAKNYINRFGGDSLETILESQGFERPVNNWGQASSALAIKSAGEVKVLIGSTPWGGSVWNTVERILLNINPYVTGIKEISGVVINYTPRVFQVPSLIVGLSSLIESIIARVHIGGNHDGK